MSDFVVVRYSECFKRQVIQEMESGRFGSAEQARLHYGIGTNRTIQQWLKRYGKADLQARVVRVEKPDEKDQLKELRRQVAALQKALGQTQAQSLANAEFLKLACEQLGQDVEAFKKKCDGRPCTGPERVDR